MTVSSYSIYSNGDSATERELNSRNVGVAGRGRGLEGGPVRHIEVTSNTNVVRSYDAEWFQRTVERGVMSRL